MSRLYKNWFVHNMFAHPLSEAVYWVIRPLGRKRADNISGWVHDVTVPVNYDIGRG